MKGILLAGGRGTRLFPMTQSVSKQLLPIYDKPMIYYPLSTLMLAGLKDILIITTPEDADNFIRLLGDGHRWGLKLSYEVQAEPEGIAQAFVIGADFIGDDHVCLILGDNIFFGHGLPAILKRARANANDSTRAPGATSIAYQVADPRDYGVFEFDQDKSPSGITEKPTTPASNWAATGLYFYDNSVVEIAKTLSPSSRGELEITDINLAYLHRGALHVERLGRGFTWFDTGVADDLFDAAAFVRTMEKRQGIKISCPEEIAFRQGFIGESEFLAQANKLRGTSYGDYLLKIHPAILADPVS